MPFTRRPPEKASASGSVTGAKRRGRPRSGAIGPVGVCFAALLMSLCVVAGAGGLYWQFFRDDVLEALLRRQADMQYAYEDRLASMRAQVDRVISRQLLDQGAVEGRVHDLLSRQAQLESRAAMIAALADQVGMGAESTSTIPQTSANALAPVRPAAPRLNQLLSGPVEPSRKQAPPAAASAYAAPEPEAPMLRETIPPAPAAPRPEINEKPRPEGMMELRSSLERPASSQIANQDAPVATRLSALGRGLERIERDQLQAVARIGAAARQKTGRLKSVIIEAGLSPDNLSPPTGKAMGGPFMPLKADPGVSLFERELTRIAADYQAASRLIQVVSTLPLRRPLVGRQEITSGYGMRMDPFMGRMALHTGLDMREETGALVRATAGGKVVSAGWSGGYGNMVEIEHGNDLSTRYGHLSMINVAEGQSVAPGTILGRVGSTGRSTGPHLHYEVRVDGEAVDPGRFMLASDKMAGLN